MSDFQPAVDAVRSAVAKRPQRQDSLRSQLQDLHVIATHLGMYDAADWMWKHGVMPPTAASATPGASDEPNTADHDTTNETGR